MLVSYRWLQEYVATQTTPAALGERFRMTSSELDGLRDYSQELSKIVVGKILSVAKHPQADKLNLVQVNVGDRTVQIVCGGSNLRPEMFVPVALPGSTVHPLDGDPFAIAKAKIRGEESEGMICSTEEIGIPIPSVNRSIWDLNELELDLVAGTPLAEALGLDDAILQLEITPNRPDLLSHFGLAREIATFEHKKLRSPEILSVPIGKAPLNVQIDCPTACDRFSVVTLSIPQLRQSPWWIQRRLLLCGIRPINMVVDITNYVMLELGQPLHAYDAESLMHEGKLNMVVRTAKPGESIHLLDGSTRNLAEGDIVIADSTGALTDLCGIMGGASSAVQQGTRHIVLEAAHFEPGTIRKTSRRLGLRSEASTRFEKGVDSSLTIQALARAAELLQTLGGALVTSNISDQHFTKHNAPEIELDFAHLHDILGVRIPPHEIKIILESLGFSILSISKSRLVCAPPSWRRDCTITEDIIEEVGRIWGFERIPTTLPSGAVKPPSSTRSFTVRNRLRAAFASLGGREVLHTPFTSLLRLQRCDLNLAPIALANPLSSNDTHLTPSHLPLLLETIAEQNIQEEELVLFEVGHVFLQPATEIDTVSILLRSAKLSHEELVARAKQYVQAALLAATTDQTPPSLLISSVSEKVVSAYKIRRGRNLVYCTFSFSELLASQSARFFKPLPGFPVSTRDITITTPEKTAWQQLAERIEEVRPAELYEWEHLDTYRSKELGPEKKSFTIRFKLTSPERTLTDAEISAAMDTLESSLGEFKA